jgi:hypothetical protein
VKYRIEPIPTASAIREAQDARWLTELLNASDSDIPARIAKLIEQIVTNGMTERALAQLIVSVRRATGEPRDVSQLLPEPPRGRDRAPERRDDRGRGRDRFDAPRGDRFDAPRGRGPEPRFSRDRDRNSEAPPASWAPGPPNGAERAGRGPDGGWVPFRVSWGEAHGADARRLVAMLCRRGGVRGSDIGAIRVDRTSSTVEVAATVAKDFERAAAEPDPRDFRVTISPLGAEPPRERSFDEAPRAPHKPRAHVPPSQHRGPPPVMPQRPFPHRAFPKPEGDDQFVKPEGERSFAKPRAERPFAKPFAKPDGERPFKPRGERPFAKRDGERPFAKRDGERPFAKRDGERPFAKRDGDRPFAKPHGALADKKPHPPAPAKKAARRVIVDAPPRRQRTKG